MIKLAVLVSGGGTNLQAIIDGINSGKIRNTGISLVISNNKNAFALKRAEKAGIRAKCIMPSNFPDRESFDEGLLSLLKESEADLIVLAGFLVIIPKEIVSEFKNRIINIHPSLIPSFCGTGCYGLKVHEKALERGVKVTGATVHFVDEGTDSGPIILQKPVFIKDGDTPEILQKRVMEEAEWEILSKAIDLFATGKLTVDGRRVFTKE